MRAPRRWFWERAQFEIVAPPEPAAEYAAELATAEPARVRDAAVRGLLTYYEETASHAPSLAWLDAERANLVAAAGLGVPGFASRLSTALWRYLDGGGGSPDEVLAIHDHALHDARHRRDRAAEGVALGRLGQAFGRMARYPAAIDHLGRSLAVCREVGDPAGENAMLNSLAQIHARSGDYAQAATWASCGRSWATTGWHAGTSRRRCCWPGWPATPAGEGEILNNLGLVNCWLGAYREAIAQLQYGLRAAREAGARAGEGRLLANLGVAYTGLGRLSDAALVLAQALEISRETGDRAAEAETLTYIGDLRLCEGHPRRALSQHDQALLTANEIGERNVQAAALNGAGRALLALGRPRRARDRHQRAHDVAVRIGDRLQQARALECLSPPQAVELYRDLGVSPGEHGERLDAGAREDRGGRGAGWGRPGGPDQAAGDQVVGRAEVTPPAVDRQVGDPLDDDLSAAVGDRP